MIAGRQFTTSSTLTAIFVADGSNHEIAAIAVNPSEGIACC